MVGARHLAADLREDGGPGSRTRRAVDRQQSRQSSPLRKRRKRGEENQAVGRSRGGRTTKIHALADDCGRPVAFVLTPGNVADITVAKQIVGAVTPSQRLLADKAYDAEPFRLWLTDRGTEAVTPSTASRKIPYPLDRAAYKRRNIIERLFCRLKNWRRIATRYDRLARNYLAAIALVSLVATWIE
ncbi:putative transposase [Parvularcula bermudensis HTCC2503]|uniref:Putative transposase n=1 Tax=Parvularcula bermudensis (strain ATCC BAA-594 / HTCC2503 / KCTC 12087) TaxID=314260 RepID=E0TIJ1_PARBH|nr:putative transposase [Parvularcula bermudensis HTCC2503]